jgi:hypothetical protein
MRAQVLVSYKGLCVGGPRAGEWVAHRTAFFDAPGCAYVHRKFDDVCEFWVPEGRDEGWALREIVRAYRQGVAGPHQKNSLPKVSPAPITIPG